MIHMKENFIRFYCLGEMAPQKIFSPNKSTTEMDF